MTVQPPQFSRPDLPFDKILARLGYARGKTKIDVQTEAMIQEEIEAGKRLIVPRQAVASAPVRRPAEGVVALDPGLTITSLKIYELLHDCVTAYGFAVTIGPHLEERRNQHLNRRETARALILDAIGSVATEELAEITHNQIAAAAAKDGLVVTRRFSPGYGDWALPSQREFLLWLGAQNIGIRLTPAFQMLPEKSVSAIIGAKPLK
jgi:hypothetical protein